MVPWRVDPRVLDPHRLAEIDLFAEVVIAATAAPDLLPQEGLDRLLGVRRPRVPFRLPTVGGVTRASVEMPVTQG